VPEMSLSKKSLPSLVEGFLILFLAGLSFLLFAISEKVVPVHYDIYGNPDGFGSRYILLLIPVFGIGLFAFIRWVKRFRDHFNYPVKITLENKAAQEALALKLLDTYCLITLIIFNLMLIHLIYHALSGKISGMWIWGLVFLISYLLPIPIYLRKAYRLK
jgi:hypothetical protein